MYFIGLKNGKQHGGNDGTMQVHGFTSPNRKTALAAKAKNWARATDNDEVYAIGSYSQEMSEMSPDDFVKAVRKSGKLLYKSSRTEGKKDTSIKLTLNESVHEGDLVKCPSCGKVDQVDNIRKPSCRNCGKDLRKTIADYNKGIFNFGNDDDEDKVTESKNSSGKLTLHEAAEDLDYDDDDDIGPWSEPTDWRDRDPRRMSRRPRDPFAKEREEGWEEINQEDYDYTPDAEDQYTFREDPNYEYQEFLYDPGDAESGPQPLQTYTMKRRRRTESKEAGVKLNLNEGSESLNKTNVMRALNNNPHSTLITIISSLEKMKTETVEEEDAIKEAVTALRKVSREIDARGD